MTGVRVGIDIGGTFTDAVMLDDGRLHVAKTRTTPGDYAVGFLDGVAALEESSGVPTTAIRYLVHGSTVATNAIVEGRTARVGLLTTAGFRDVLEIGTQLRSSLYDARVAKPEPLVPRELRLEVDERIGPQGEVVRPLDEADVRAAARTFADAGVGAVAVVFLFSFVNAEHEERAAEILRRELPGVPVSLSSQVAPEFREYVRTSTTVLNAGLLPLVGAYVSRLAESTTARGVEAPLHLMQSSGGVGRAEVVRDLPVTLVASGPAAGVIGAARIGESVGEADLLTFDMGGTTADVALVVDGRPQIRFQGDVGGHPINVPQIDVLSVGAGGGSIVRVDAFGSLRVGPESAGAEPGPAAYGLGGTAATVTDAHVVLGTLDPARFLGGRMPLDPDRARQAIEEHVARPLGLSAEQAAAAALRIADTTMARALRVISVARGHDPRDFALVAFGGAGPMHACALADELGVRRVVVPRYPGVSSALGLLLSDIRHDLRRTWVRCTHELEPAELGRRLAELEEHARRLIAGSDFRDGEVDVGFELDMRYRGQAYELTVPVQASLPADELVRAAENAFHDAHRRTYGHASPVDEVEIVTLRAHAVVPTAPPTWAADAGTNGAARRREAWLGGERVEATVVGREAVPAAGLAGPALVEQDDTTIVIPPGWRIVPAAGGNAVVERERG